jgi:hypothetical protein
MRSSSPVLLAVTLLAAAAYWYDATNEATAEPAPSVTETPAAPLAQAADAHPETAKAR